MDYKRILAAKKLDVIAVTDHDRIDLAMELHHELGQQIIVGEEIMTTDGEVIGLFLQEWIAPHQSIHETIRCIRDQSGLVYLPHPFDRHRHGIRPDQAMPIAEIDILESFNARCQDDQANQQAWEFAQTNDLLAFSSSDSHSVGELGSTYTQLPTLPTASNLLDILSEATFHDQAVHWRQRLNPTINRLRHLVKRVQ